MNPSNDTNPFDLNDGPRRPDVPKPEVVYYGYQEAQQQRPQPKKTGGIIGTLSAIGLALVKYGTIALTFLSKLKFLFILKTILFSGGSAILSAWFLSLHYGWPMGVGIISMIFFHEMGHGWASRKMGFPFAWLVFTPFGGGNCP